jgi:hypothetical protein
LACGATLSEDDMVCPQCGAEVEARAQPELVENLAVEMIMIDQRGFTLRLRNSGTAPLTVVRVTYAGQPTEITNLSTEKGTVKDGRLTLEPGDLGELTFRTSYSGSSGVTYDADILTSSGKSYRTLVGFP